LSGHEEDSSAYNKALAESGERSRELLELQRETNRLLGLIVKKLERGQE